MPALPKIPAPLFALVGVTDIATEKARALPVKLAELELRRFDAASVAVARDRARETARTAAERIDLTKLDPRKAELPNVELPSKADLPKVELSDLAARAFEFAAVAERTYDDLVVRGERVVAAVRGTEHLTAPAADEPAAKPAAAASATKPTKKATKPATKPAAKRTTDPEA
ncbi:MAG: hypothetical protein WAN48_12550 [Actinomycetes bacterium]